ncbi:MAG TPA: DMT family transporter, partial [Gammaproteobacteria bacterium]|nr:DMT family transporter [Gammaproteobacteria bacterium]
LQMAGFTALVITALQFVPAGRSAILAYTTPLWVTPGAVLFLGEEIGPMKGAGLVLGLAGIGVLFNPFDFDWHNPDILLGNGLLLLAAFLWAALILAIRGHRWDGSPLSLMPWQFSIAAMILVPTAWVVEGGHTIDWGWTLGGFLLYNGPLATAFCFWAIITVNRSLPAITTSLGTLGVPALGLAVSALALGERLTIANTGGLVLILSGLAVVTLADRRAGRT